MESILASNAVYSSIESAGPVTIDGASLQVLPQFQPLPGSAFTLIRNGSGHAVVGTFASLPEGASFTASGVRFTITYKGHGGDDVVITAQQEVPVPATGSGVGLGVALITFGMLLSSLCSRAGRRAVARISPRRHARPQSDGERRPMVSP